MRVVVRYATTEEVHKATGRHDSNSYGVSLIVAGHINDVAGWIDSNIVAARFATHDKEWQEGVEIDHISAWLQVGGLFQIADCYLWADVEGAPPPKSDKKYDWAIDTVKPAHVEVPMPDFNTHSYASFLSLIKIFCDQNGFVLEDHDDAKEHYGTSTIGVIFRMDVGLNNWSLVKPPKACYPLRPMHDIFLARTSKDFARIYLWVINKAYRLEQLGGADVDTTTSDGDNIFGSLSLAKDRNGSLWLICQHDVRVAGPDGFGFYHVESMREPGINFRILVDEALGNMRKRDYDANDARVHQR